MIKTVISTIAIAFAQTKGNGFISFDPLVSKDAPVWLPLEKNFKEAQDKGFVRLSQGVEVSKVTELDPELVKVASNLNLTFNADIKQSLLEDMVEDAQKKHAEVKVEESKKVTVVKETEIKKDVTTEDLATDDVEAKRTIIEELQGLGFNSATVKWKLETLQNKLIEVKGK